MSRSVRSQLATIKRVPAKHWIIIPLVLALAFVLSSCRLLFPTSTLTPDEGAVQTRVVATLTALAEATSQPLPSPTSTSQPPSATPTFTQTATPSEPVATDTVASATLTPTATPVAPTLTQTLAPPTPTDTPLPTPTSTTAVPTATSSPTPVPPTPTSTPSPTPTPTPSSTPTSSPTPVPIITDWRGEYYANRDLSGTPRLVRNDIAISFDWGQGPPASGLPTDDFGARWTQTLGFDGATYRFFARVDDGVRLWLDNQLVIDAWYDSSVHTVTGVLPVVRGTHRVQVDYYDHNGSALVQAWWEKLESYPDWRGEYYDNRDLGGSPALVRNDLNIDFDWGAGAPVPGLPTDSFSVRWSRSLNFDASTYRFHVLVDDGARLWVDGQLIIDSWYDARVREVTTDYALAEGQHLLRLEYYEHEGGARVGLWWDRVASPSFPDWKGEYWANQSFSGSPALVRNDQTIDFIWGTGAPAPGLPSDGFTVRWSREVRFDLGLYRLSARADDGIRVYLDGDLVIDEWHASRGDVNYTADRTLTGPHRIVVEYYEGTGNALVRLVWQRLREGPPRG